MTISYSPRVATCSRFGNFWKLLFLYRGSVWELMLPNACLYFGIFATLSFAYRNCMDDRQRDVFEKICLSAQRYHDKVPIAFVLGFFVNFVVDRWWSQFMTIPWPDNSALLITGNLRGTDDRAKMTRRQMIRYFNASFVMMMRIISPGIRDRFSSDKDFINGGFLNERELHQIECLHANESDRPNYCVPIAWIVLMAQTARREGHIEDDAGYDQILEAIIGFQKMSHVTLTYDWFNIPLVYVQTVTLAVSFFFMVSLFSQQFLDEEKKIQRFNDYYVPYFLMLEFLLFNGWLKVAEVLINPYGYDGDDYDVDWLVDRNLVVSNYIADDLNGFIPELCQDFFWNDDIPETIPDSVVTPDDRCLPGLLDPTVLARQYAQLTGWKGDSIPEYEYEKWEEMMLELTGYYAERADIIKADQEQEAVQRREAAEREVREADDTAVCHQHLVNLRENWAKIQSQMKKERKEKKVEVLFKRKHPENEDTTEDSETDSDADDDEEYVPSSWYGRVRLAIAKFCCPKYLNPASQPDIIEHEHSVNLSEDDLRNLLNAPSQTFGKDIVLPAEAEDSPDTDDELKIPEEIRQKLDVGKPKGK